ncbi:DinB family protein [Epilithonimonas sp. JDS]|uniref:DinB family protein n=1 Tax=Epilithonimonas sp. JDS TaxID=2902797 RepID=UPI001E50863E|nr:DinB family protein [Epilithonimonas sp. JDS]MCD9855111.1 DinB family protein [Epilithonimonas sp. JDS]
MTDFEKYIQRYLDLVPSENWIEELQISGKQTLDIYVKLSEEQGNFAYAEGKWTLKTLLQHLIDTEKVFAYRALRFSRNDQSLVSGFDEEAWADNSYAESRTLKSLIKEFKLTRKLSIKFFKTLPVEALSLIGIVNGNEIKVETIGKLTVGHNLHHLNVIKERYLPNT